MPSPLHLPLRVLVKGSSMVNWTYPLGGPRSDLLYPRAIEAQLLAEGRPCEVRAITRMADRASDLLKTWQQEILGYSPDVIILHYCGYEAIHLFLPRWLERHVNSLSARPRLISRAYRKFLLRPIWMVLAGLQAKIDTKIPMIRKAPARRMVADLARYITQVQMVGSPMVLLVELHQVTERRLRWFPGLNVRLDQANEVIAEVVASIDKPHVRLFPVRELITKHFNGDLTVAISDGFHYAPELHRVVGSALAQEISEWADTQPHLTHQPE